jgi:hypothetical protein
MKRLGHRAMAAKNLKAFNLISLCIILLLRYDNK